MHGGRSETARPIEVLDPEVAGIPSEGEPGVAATANAAPPHPQSVTGAHPTPTPEAGEPPPARAEGVELIGEFEQSGFEDPPSLARRADGQVVQLTELLYATLEAVDGRRDYEAIAAEVSQKMGRTATAENVRFLLDKKLRPLGLLKLPDGSDPSVKKSSPLLALRWKCVLCCDRLTARLTTPFSPLFHGIAVLAVLAGFVAVSGWVLFSRGLAQGTREAFYSPGLLLMVFALTIASAAFHEFGHAAACRYGGAKPGSMGAGIYLVWPAFYTDVTDAYRLGRAGRLRTDLGGLYFNAIFVLLTFGAWAATGSEVFLLFVPIQLFQMVHQLLPVVRMDGYYILSDLTGVPDLFARIKPTLASAVPGKDTDERAARLKPWVRVVVVTWVLIVVPLLLAGIVLAVIALPRVAATAWDSAGQQWDALTAQADAGDWLAVAARALGLVALALPVAGTAYTMSRFGRRAGQGAWSGLSRHPGLRLPAAVVGLAAVAGLAWLWWPNGEYEPIQRNERGTVTEGVRAVKEVSTGRPGLTEEREQEVEVEPESPVADDVPGDAPVPDDPALSPTEELGDQADTQDPAPTTTTPEEADEPTATTVVDGEPSGESQPTEPTP